MQATGIRTNFRRETTSHKNGIVVDTNIAMLRPFMTKKVGQFLCFPYQVGGLASSPGLQSRGWGGGAGAGGEGEGRLPVVDPG